MKWLAVLLVACSAGEPGPGVDVDRAMQHAAALVAMGPRHGNSPAAQQAAAYIEAQLPRAERGAIGVVDLPAIEVMGTTYRRAHRTTTSDPNLVARFGPKQGKALLFMAHYDTVHQSPGAIDNAAAVGILVELARVLDASPPPFPVIVAITAREEDGLIGAEALASDLDDIDFAIALDLIGGDADLVLNGASMLIGDAEMHWLADAADRAGIVLRAPLAHRVVSRWWPQAERSDHGPFTRRSIRAVHLYHRGHDGEFIDRAYHTRFDRFERIDRSRVDEVGRFVRALAAAAPPKHAGDGFWLPVVANVVVPRWIVIVVELALVLLAIAMIVRMRRERARGGAGLLAGFGCLVVAIIVAYLVERLFDSPAAWIHAPAYHVFAEALVLAGIVGLASRIVARRAPWIGARRYLVAAIGLMLVVGVFWFAVGAAELAWVWLVPAASASCAPFARRWKLACLAPTFMPVLVVLAPDRLREAAWNGFLSPSVPVVAWLGLVGIPPLLAVVYAFRDRRHSGPLGAFVLAVGWGLAIAIGILMILRFESPCSALQFQEFHLTCEIASGV